MNKTFALLCTTCAISLVACGQTSHPTTGSSPSASQAVTLQTMSSQGAGAARPLDAGAIVAAKPTGQPCSFDSDPHVTPGKPQVFKGWLLGPSRKPAGAFTLVMQGSQTFGIQSTTGATRPDVGKYLGEPALAAAGFRFTGTLTAIPPGNYKVELLITRGSEAYVCDTGKVLIVD